MIACYATPYSIHSIKQHWKMTQTTWWSKWGIKFNASKCEVMRIARTKNPLEWMYTISGKILKEVDKAKYLGDTVSNSLQWSGHVSSITKKVNSTLAFLHHNLTNAVAKVKETAYFSLVQSVLEYSTAVWDLHLQKDIDAVEMVQCRAIRDVRATIARQAVCPRCCRT